MARPTETAELPVKVMYDIQIIFNNETLAIDYVCEHTDLHLQRKLSLHRLVTLAQRKDIQPVGQTVGNTVRVAAKRPTLSSVSLLL